jgi:hypothetical protein
MKPPIKIQARTNNLNECSLEVSGAEGIAEVVRVGVTGNVYQGLHAAAPQLERIFNDVLAAHGIVPPPPPPKEEEAPETNRELGEETTT